MENGTWSSDVLLVLLDLPYNGTPSTTITLRTSFGTSGYQRTSTEAAMDYKLAQPSNIQDTANSGKMSTRVVHPLATATGSVGDGQPIAPNGSGGSATIVNHDMTIPQKKWWTNGRGMTGATSGVGHNQALQGLDGGVHRVPVISLVGNGVDSKDQTATGESSGGKGPPRASIEMEVDMPDGKKSPEISPGPNPILDGCPKDFLAYPHQ